MNVRTDMTMPAFPFLFTHLPSLSRRRGKRFAWCGLFFLLALSGLFLSVSNRAGAFPAPLSLSSARITSNDTSTNYTYTNHVETNYVSNCVVQAVTTNTTPGVIYPGQPTVTPNPVCVGETVTFSAGYWYYTGGYQEIVTTYSGDGYCPPTTSYSYLTPSVLSQSYTVTGPATTSGTNGSVSINPNAPGSGVVTFTLTYDNGAGGTETVQSATYYTVIDCTNTTNCTTYTTTTNCTPGSLSYGPASVSPSETNCLGTTVTVSLGYPQYTPGFMEIVTTYSGSNCPQYTTSYPVYPYVVDVTYSISGSYSGSGLGSSVSLTPTNAGSGSVTFTITYDDGCGGMQTTTSSGSFSISECATNCVETSRATNCLSSASITLTPNTNSIEVCLGSSVSASATSSNWPGVIEIITYYSNCAPVSVTNSINAIVVSNWWVASGPGGFSASGGGLSASFTPTNAGFGTITFYCQYSNPPPCWGSGPASTSVSFTVHGTTKTTNCLTAPSVSLTAATNNVLTNCLGSPISASVTASYVTGKVEVVTSSTSTNCPNSRVTNNVTSTVVSNWWVASGPGGFTASGSGLSASFTPTNSGNGTLTFYLQYSNQPPCPGSSTVSLGLSYTIHGTTKTTNCLTPPSVTLAAGTNNTLTNCFGSAISASALATYVTGKVEIVTSSTSTNCPNSRVTNNVISTVVTNWWVASGPGSFTTNGPGLSASFTPTNSGNGTVTFYLRYTNAPPCTGSNTVSLSLNYTIHGITRTTNCLTEASVQFTNISGSFFAALGSSITGTAQWRFQTGKIEIVTASTSTNCPNSKVTNDYTSTIVSNWWTAVGPGTFSTNGTGITASFRPNQVGTGVLTFYLRYTNRSPCTGSNTISISSNYVVFKVEILDRGGNVISGTNLATNAVRYILKSRVTPDMDGLTYLWKIEGGVPPATVAIKIYRHVLPKSSGADWEHRATNMVAADMTSSNLNFFWTREGVRNVSLDVTKNGATASTNVYVRVVNDPDPNKNIYSRLSPTEDHNPTGSGGIYKVCENHGYWHHGTTTPSGGQKYDSDMGGVDYRGLKFFNWHKAIIDLHQAWRTTFGITTPIDATLGTWKPSYFTNSGGHSNSQVYKYVRLDEYPTQEQLGDDIHLWHGAGHNNQRTVDEWIAAGYAGGSWNVPEIEDPYQNLAGRTNNFWSWHSNIEALRATIPLTASPATVVGAVPAHGAAAVPKGGTTIDVIFNKPVSANGPQAGAAAVRNDQCTLPARVELIPPGGASTNTPSALVVTGSSTNRHHRFTVPAMNALGVWTFRLIGTPRGYVGVTNTFTVVP
jgi:hypothetical protein